jgi:hypothetical protein
MVVQLTAGRALRWGAAAAVVTAALSACSGSGAASTAVGAPSAAGTTAADGPRDGRGTDPAQLRRIQECLAAAGLVMPTPSGGPRTFNPTDRPTGAPSGSPRARPSGAPTDGRFGGAGRGLFADPKVRAALEACGITMPTRAPTGPAAGVTPAPATTG